MMSHYEVDDEDLEDRFMIRFNTFQELEDQIWELRGQDIEGLIYDLEDMPLFRQGYIKGRIDALEEIARGIRYRLKHSDDLV